MPGFSIGCPHKLLVCRGGQRDRPTTILAMALDPLGQMLAILTRHELQVSMTGCLERGCYATLGLSRLIDDEVCGGMDCCDFIRSGMGGTIMCCWVGLIQAKDSQ